MNSRSFPSNPEIVPGTSNPENSFWVPMEPESNVIARDLSAQPIWAAEPSTQRSFEPDQSRSEGMQPMEIQGSTPSQTELQ